MTRKQKQQLRKIRRIANQWQRRQNLVNLVARRLSGKHAETFYAFQRRLGFGEALFIKTIFDNHEQQRLNAIPNDNPPTLPN